MKDERVVSEWKLCSSCHCTSRTWENNHINVYSGYLIAKRDVRRNLIGLKTTFVIAEPIKFRVSRLRLTSL